MPVRQCDARGKLFLLVAAAGTGKTCTDEALIACLRAATHTNTSCIAVSTTAISAQLLPDGHTAHSTLKFPIKITDGMIVRSAIEFDSECAEQLKKAQVLFWDEAFGARKELIEAADHFFRELKGNDEPFGGVVIFFSGDLRQTLPKLPRGGRAHIVKLCFANSRLFSKFKIMSLTENLRLLRSSNPEFAQFVLNVGDGLEPIDSDGRVSSPSHVHLSKSIEELIEFVCTKDLTKLNPSQLSERAISAPLNVDVREINDCILQTKLPGAAKTYLSTDTELDEDDNPIEEMPPEILNGLNRPGFPVHALKLKHNCIVMCLRNLSSLVCNGTKIQITML